MLAAYVNYMTEVGVLLGGEENSTREQMSAVVEFETKLANVSESLAAPLASESNHSHFRLRMNTLPDHSASGRATRRRAHVSQNLGA